MNKDSDSPIWELYVASYEGRKVLTTFTGHLAIPHRAQIEALMKEISAFYDVYSDEQIDAINEAAELQFHRDIYQPQATLKTTKKPTRHEKPGFIYLVQSVSGHYKIGLTANPEHRGKTFGVQLPFEVEFICLIKTDNMQRLETELHERFADKRVNGEWFDLTPEDVEYIKGLAT